MKPNILHVTRKYDNTFLLSSEEMNTRHIVESRIETYLDEEEFKTTEEYAELFAKNELEILNDLQYAQDRFLELELN